MHKNRFRRRRQRTGHLHPAAIVGICLGAAILLTLIVGNLLKLWLDEETFQKWTEGTAAPPAEDQPLDIRVPNVNAYPFDRGDEIDRFFGTASVSFCLNRDDGTLLYSSPVAENFGLSDAQNPDLAETLSELCSVVPYVSGVFTPNQALDASPALQYAAAVTDAALLREFVQSGGEEILLVGLSLDMSSLSKTMVYLEAVKAAAPETPLGVAVPREVATSFDGWEILSTLLTVCDFCALDLTSESINETAPTEGDVSPAAQQLLQSAAYYLEHYRMRVLVSESQTALVTTLEILFHSNFQILSSVAD